MDNIQKNSRANANQQAATPAGFVSPYTQTG
jgi:hypothetical protein